MKEREFINPFTDFGFKRIFGQEINKELTIDFLNLLLDGERHIADLTIHNPEIQRRNGWSCLTCIAKAMTERSLS